MARLAGRSGARRRRRGLGLWKALRKVYPRARAQRCWAHKTRNVLDKLPKGARVRAKDGSQQIWIAKT